MVDHLLHNFSKTRTLRAKMGHMSPTCPLLGLFVICTLEHATFSICAKPEVPIFTHYGNMKGNAKCIKYKKSHTKKVAIW